MLLMSEMMVIGDWLGGQWCAICATWEYYRITINNYQLCAGFCFLFLSCLERWRCLRARKRRPREKGVRLVLPRKNIYLRKKSSTCSLLKTSKVHLNRKLPTKKCSSSLVYVL
jgi:hypothetical protein